MHLKSRGFTNKSLVFVLLSGALIGSAALTYQSSVLTLLPQLELKKSVSY